METTYNELEKKDGVPGLQTGLRCPTPERRLAPIRPCERCGKPFRPRKDALAKGDGRFCSRRCGGNAAIHSGNFKTPSSTKIERVRANGLVNKRLKLGWFKRPDECQKCQKVGRVDGHHSDYMQPGHVAYVCRSCHMMEHNHPGYLIGVKPIDTSVRLESCGGAA